MMFAAAILALVVGACGVVAGVRGRRINDHPICRVCRFDLTGVYPAPLCPECGAGLLATQGRAPVLMGERRRRWWALIPGVALVLMGGAGALLGVSDWAFSLNLIPYEPTWLV